MRTFALVAAILIVGLTASAYSPAARAADPPAAVERAKACDKQATYKKLQTGKRDAFMKACLASDLPPEDTNVTGEQLSRQCSAVANAQAMTGEDRIRFIDECMRKVPKE
jgi:hypothetical protein